MHLHHLFAIIAALTLNTGAAYACAPGDELRAGRTLADLSAAQREGFEVLFQTELQIMQAERVAVDDAFGFDTCDLSGTSNDVIVLTAKPGLFCDTICMMWAMNRTEDDVWQLILAAEGTVTLAQSYSMGWPDLVARTVGQPDTIHKFDGASYRDELDGLIYGEVFELPEATSWQADLSGFAGIVPDAPGPNSEADTALQAIAQLLGGSPDNLITGLTDLNGDDVPEVIVQSESAAFCTADGCRTWIVSVHSAGATIMADVIAQGSLEVAASRNGAYRDVIVWGSAGAQVLRHDGVLYR